ncbi:hypothetical protein AMATHDRAFT_71380 [Amanita thiersii Skay4041]|uniref:Uncharacterized protein n=1 Tax=Amanita thiersii Skay4041 TaxID=703135 RepID=A0A2A9N7R9_9AGAR|nr:hypothetical protein AMATHDRAFT_71380 [Amanita thiersii Skay4041]
MGKSAQPVLDGEGKTKRLQTIPDHGSGVTSQRGFANDSGDQGLSTQDPSTLPCLTG